MIYSITDKRLFNVIDVIMREEFGNYTIIDNDFYAEHGFFSVKEFPAFTVLDTKIYLNSTQLIGFIDDIIDLTSVEVLKFYFSKVFNRLIDKIYNAYGHEI
jgi:hypothetical protein